MTRTRLRIALTPRRVGGAALLGIAGSVAGHVAGLVSTQVFGVEHLLGLVPLFNLEGEGNAPALFSTCLLLACAAGLWVSGRAATRVRVCWFGLSAIFVVLGVSEIAQLHEPILFVLKGNVSPATEALAKTMPLRFANMVPELVVFGAVIAVVTTLFLRTLERRTATLFVAAGVLYVTGAALLDAVTAKGSSIAPPESVAVVLRGLEEVLEMFGASLFLYAILDRLVREHGVVSVELGTDMPSATPGPSLQGRT